MLVRLGDPAQVTIPRQPYALIPPSSLLNGLWLPPATRVLDLERRLRCRECDQRGKAIVSIKWAAG